MKKIITLIMLCILFIVGCSQEEFLFKGTVIAVEPTIYTLGIIVENDDGQRIRIDKIYNNATIDDIAVVIVGDSVEILYDPDNLKVKFLQIMQKNLK